MVRLVSCLRDATQLVFRAFEALVGQSMATALCHPSALSEFLHSDAMGDAAKLTSMAGRHGDLGTRAAIVTAIELYAVTAATYTVLVAFEVGRIQIRHDDFLDRTARVL
jgi:hypothetical protein